MPARRPRRRHSLPRGSTAREGDTASSLTAMGSLRLSPAEGGEQSENKISRTLKITASLRVREGGLKFVARASPAAVRLRQLKIMASFRVREGSQILWPGHPQPPIGGDSENNG